MPLNSVVVSRVPDLVCLDAAAEALGVVGEESLFVSGHRHHVIIREVVAWAERIYYSHDT